MSTQIQRRRGTTSQHSTFTGALGEITVDTDKKTAVIHDGVTAGGSPLAKELSSITGNLDRKHFSIGCIPRCTGGVFSLLDDAGHHPMNVASVTQPDAYAIRINYAKTATKINSFVVGADDALAPHGVIAGGDVGTSYANIQAFAPLRFFADNNNAPPNGVFTDLWAPSFSAGAITLTHTDASTLTVTHPPVAHNTPATVSLVNFTYNQFTPVVSFNDTTVVIIMKGDAAGYISYDGSSWSQSISQMRDAPTLTWTASNTLKIEIPNSPSSAVPVVSSHQGGVIPAIYNIGVGYFEVAFYDYAGVRITTPSTAMKFWYRQDFRVPVVWPSGAIVSVDRGICHVPSANFSGVAGNNFWVAGDMEY